MGNGPVVNSEAVKAAMKRKELKVEELASKLGKSISLTRNVINGYLPRKDQDDFIRALAKILDLRQYEIVIHDDKAQSA